MDPPAGRSRATDRRRPRFSAMVTQATRPGLEVSLPESPDRPSVNVRHPAREGTSTEAIGHNESLRCCCGCLARCCFGWTRARSSVDCSKTRHEGIIPPNPTGSSRMNHTTRTHSEINPVTGLICAASESSHQATAPSLPTDERGVRIARGSVVAF